MTLKHMYIYLAVCRTENITKAANLLHMTQPAVSRSVQEIERYYGVRLFERINRKLHITEAGKEFYTYALHIIDSFEQMEQGMRNWDELGLLRIGSSITLGNVLLPGVMAAFRKTHGELRIRATVANGQSLQKALLENRLDLAVIEGNVTDPQLCCEVIGTDRLVPILPPEDPQKDRRVELRELAGRPLLLREPGSAGRSFLQHVFALHGLPLDPTMESVSTQAILRAVHGGLGISFLPEKLVKDSVQRGIVSTCIVTDEAFLRENYLVWHKQKYLTGAAKALMELFRIHAADLIR